MKKVKSLISGVYGKVKRLTKRKYKVYDTFDEHMILFDDLHQTQDDASYRTQ